MPEFAVQAGVLAPVIHVGRTSADGKTFAAKADLTDEVLFAVATFVRDHFDGGMEMTFRAKRPGARDLVLKISTSEEVER